MAQPLSKIVEAGRVEAALRAVLPPTAQLVLTRATGAVVKLSANGHRLRARWAGEGWLRQVREIIGDDAERPDVVVARRMSPGAQEALAGAGIGWADESGAAEIALGTLIVSRTGRPEMVAAKRAHWTPAVLAVAEALLCGVRGTVAATEDATNLSTGSCTNALRTLTDLGLVAAEVARGPGAERRIVDADQLLDAYASATRALAPKESLQLGVTWRDAITGLAELGRQLQANGVAWATTGAAASMVLAPFLTTVSATEIYVDARTPAQLDAVANRIGLRPIDGGRLTLRPFPTVSTRLLAEDAHGLRVAPWPRVYADLRMTGVRGEEAAEHLLETIRGQ